MDLKRADNIYKTFIQQKDPEDPGTKDVAMKALAKPSDAIADAVVARGAELLPAIDGAGQKDRFKQTITLLTALETERGVNALSEAEYTTCLVRWNKWFRQKQLKLNQPPIKSEESVALITEIHDASWQKDEGFKAFCLAVPDPQRRLVDMRKAFADAGLPLMSVYPTMHFLRQHALPVDYLSKHTATDIHYLSAIAPPLTAFAGFADWGPGNSGNVADNKKNHFLKHVLDAHPAENLPWQGECAHWWKALDVELTRKAAAAGLGGALFNTVKAHFPPGDDDPLPFAKVEAVVGAVKANGGWPALLRDQLANRYAAAYAAYAINLSKAMTDVIVHTDAEKSKVYVKGLNGLFYLGGRIEGSTLGLSTCFIPVEGTDVKNLHLPRKIWQVSPN